ncbi:MAG: oxidoreductase [Marinobacter sp.]|uniref:acrylyl-CoA reductase (NADPH) n=1 Tax=Marinobacter sp. TaxID=50741 RepID=UPI001B774A75|nr:MDR family oxidoreductase [Marinobacter sp.]MBQ0746550.1 oxidoreductase [Marinobacter sp.]MBQ0814296.1 oxidoreductase [Marinobacter sp.]|tara:strand:+ start:10387 stop:11370 length:984 start_codon:yes stop_codon:yes gene_type:complete
MFKGILIEKDDAGYRAQLKDIDEAVFHEGDVTIRVNYSTINYKDALAITGKGPVVRRFPMIPGIDLVGTVEHSDSADYKVGDTVVHTGWGVGEVHPGGLAEKARLKSEWLVPLPEAFSPTQAMSIGTAGFTAMLCVMTLERQGVTPDKGEILVTGAAGGVGSVAVSLLTKLGYTVVGVCGDPSETDYIKSLGASEVLDRSEFSSPAKPIAKERWAGAIDVVGSHTLANVCSTMKYRGVVAACGLAGGMDFPSSVAPFILRGVTLAGVDSVMCPRPERLSAWKRLGRDLDASKLEMLSREIGLSEVIPVASDMLEGKLRGRVLVDVSR